MGTIIAAFAGVGKSYVGKKYSNVIDLESTYFKWLDNSISTTTKENNKSCKIRGLNPEWPYNYVRDIMIERDSHDIVLIILGHKRLKSEKIFEYFDEHEIEYCVARPNITAWPIIEKRLIDNNVHPENIKQIKDNFKVFIEEFSKPKYKQIIIEDGEFLEDALIKNGFLQKQD